MSRIFSDEELKELSKSLPQKALEALDKGETGKLSQLLLQMSTAHTALHFLGVAAITRIWAKWQQDYGQEKTREMLERIGRQVMRPYIEQFLQGQEKETFSELIDIYKHHVGAKIVPLGQADDAIEFSLAPCGSGGINVLKGFEKKMPHWYTRFDDGTPIFCVGCKSLQKALNDAAEEKIWTTEINKKLPGGCTMRFRQKATRGQKLYSETELYELPKSRAEKALNLIASDKLEVRELIDGQETDWAGWHDTLMVWNEYTFAACEELGGMTYLEDCLKEGYDSSFSFLYASMEGFETDKDRVDALAQNWHYHQGAFRIEEEDDRFVFVLDPCGSGGRMLREEMTKDRFHYGGELAPIVKQPHDLTFNRTDFPMYCVHCASGNKDQFKGNPLIFVVDGHAQMRKGMPCRQYVWKKGVKGVVETELLKQVGMDD